MTPDFLKDAIVSLREADIDIVSLDEVHRRLTAGDFKRRFAAITFDDGYRDNKTFAQPILKAYDVPYAIYIPTSFPDRLGELWWLALEAVLDRADHIALDVAGKLTRFDCSNPERKRQSYDTIYWWLRSLDDEDDLRRIVRELSARHGIDLKTFCEQQCMTWSELSELAADPLVTIGAHTVNHIMLKKASENVVRAEMRMSAAVIEAALRTRPAHFSYPIGDPTSAGPREFRIAAELGFKTAVTTRPGVLFPEHRAHMTALPRISLNGDFQSLRYMRALMSGVPTALWNGFRRVDAA